MKPKFLVLMPNYNNFGWLDNSISSVINQDYEYFELYFCDDCSTDESLKVAESFYNINIYGTGYKLWNGGTRNFLMKTALGGLESLDNIYIVFIDSDDWFTSDHVLSDIAKCIEKNNYPDCVRLSYVFALGDKKHDVILTEHSPEEMIGNENVACWTKCIKASKIVPFPENTLREDAVQHLKQCDIIETVVPLLTPTHVWNRNNLNSCSRSEKLQNGKWVSSLYRYWADLYDLELDHEWAKQEKLNRLNKAQSDIDNKVYVI